MKMSEAWAALEAGKTLLIDDRRYKLDSSGKLMWAPIDTKHPNYFYRPTDPVFCEKNIEATIEPELVDPYEALRDIVEREGAEYEIPAITEGPGQKVFLIGEMGRFATQLKRSDFQCKWEKIK